jgi:hypothetical protein
MYLLRVFYCARAWLAIIETEVQRSVNARADWNIKCRSICMLHFFSLIVNRCVLAHTSDLVLITA